MNSSFDGSVQMKSYGIANKVRQSAAADDKPDTFMDKQEMKRQSQGMDVTNPINQQSATNCSVASSIQINQNVDSSQRTLFSEFETIDIALKIIDLVQTLHQKNIVHTNLCPENIFLRNGSTNKMCFLNLYHCSWKIKDILKNTNVLGADLEDNLSVYDIRTRNKHYVSPEQIKIFEELAEIAMQRNGKIEKDSYEI